jgi:hypothetical protein
MLSRYFLVLSLLLATGAYADHLPSNKVAHGRSDSVLCGVNVVVNPKMASVIERLGKPSSVTGEDMDRHYIWAKGGAKLDVATSRVTMPSGEPGREYIVRVDMRGPKPDGLLGCTGRGLCLGDTIAKVNSIYGTRYETKVVKGLRHVSIQWADTTWLEVEFNANRRIESLTLLTPE